MKKVTHLSAVFAVLWALLGMAPATLTAAFAQGVAATQRDSQKDDQDNEEDASSSLPVGVVFTMTNVTASRLTRSLEGALAAQL